MCLVPLLGAPALPGGGDPSKLYPHRAKLGLETLRRVNPEEGAGSPSDKPRKAQPQGAQKCESRRSPWEKKGTVRMCVGQGRRAVLGM